MRWFFRRVRDSSFRRSSKKARHLGFEQVEVRQMLSASPIVNFTSQGALGPFVTSSLAVTSVTPSDGSTNVSIDASLAVQFNNTMNAATITSSTVTLADGQGNAIAATVGYDAGTNSATLVPDAPLSRSTSYTLTVTGGAGGVADTNGNTLAADFTASFTTEAPLSIVAVTPGDGSTNVSVNSAVSVQFDNSMNAATVNSSTLTLFDGQGNAVAATVTYDAGTDTATLTPSAPLSNSTSYTLDVTGGAGGVADADGGTLATDFISSFTTIAPLSIVGVTPADGSTNVSVNSDVTVQFDNAMNAATVNSSTVTLMVMDKATRSPRR